MKPKIFLGGTCGENNWRNQAIELLTKAGVPAERIYNPVVPDWTPECQAAEDKAKADARWLLYYIGNPYTPGNEVSALSLVEITMELYDDPARIVCVFDYTNLSPHVEKAMRKVVKNLRARFNGAFIFESLETACDILSAGCSVEHSSQPAERGIQESATA